LISFTAKIASVGFKAIFEQGYEMLGIDISEEYLAEYRRILKLTDCWQIVCRTTKNDTFDLINYTDILELCIILLRFMKPIEY
jgi:hypothetical protein